MAMDYKQSGRARRDESRGEERMERREKMRSDRSGMGGGSFNLKDNEQAWIVKKVNTNSEQYDTKRIRPYQDGSKGYPAEAWNYKY